MLDSFREKAAIISRGKGVSNCCENQDDTRVRFHVWVKRCRPRKGRDVIRLWSATGYYFGVWPRYLSASLLAIWFSAGQRPESGIFCSAVSLPRSVQRTMKPANVFTFNKRVSTLTTNPDVRSAASSNVRKYLYRCTIAQGTVNVWRSILWNSFENYVGTLFFTGRKRGRRRSTSCSLLSDESRRWAWEYKFRTIFKYTKRFDNNYT